MFIILFENNYSMRLSFNLQIGHGIIIRIPLKQDWTKRKAL